jgi:hypothetical protein
MRYFKQQQLTLIILLRLKVYKAPILLNKYTQLELDHYYGDRFYDVF